MKQGKMGCENGEIEKKKQGKYLFLNKSKGLKREKMAFG